MEQIIPIKLELGEEIDCAITEGKISQRELIEESKGIFRMR